MLEVCDLRVRYGSHQVIMGISFSVSSGKCVALIGANGAGKTTIAQALGGVGGAATGSVVVGGRSVLGRRGDEIVKAGLALVPERGGIFARMNVEENLLIAKLAARGRRSQQANAWDLSDAYEMFPSLAARRRQPADVLSGGERRMLLLARSLMSVPDVLVLDEPCLGLSPKLKEDVVVGLVPALLEMGKAVLLIEEEARVALSVAETGLLLSGGLIVWEGLGKELLQNETLLAGYLGG